MQIRKFFTLVWLALLAGCAHDVRHHQTTLHVMSSGGFTAAYQALAPQFERQSGIKLDTVYGASTGGAPDSIPERLKRGEVADVIILDRSSLDTLTAQGFINAATRKDLVRSQIGMAVRQGALVPDITTPEKFLGVLSNAKSIGYSASASGQYLSTTLFPKLGFTAIIEPKFKRIVSERVGTVVARGEVEIGFQQVSELLPIQGITYVGRIPQMYQKTTTFAIGVTQKSLNPHDATRLIQFLSAKAAFATIEATGLDVID